MDDITYSGIREAIVSYYSQQTEFKDFNWTAPAISTLIDAQAYLGYWMNTYANFALNESFLDTAVKRNSVVSKAENIGYTPTQYTAAKATVQLTYIGTLNVSDYVIPSGATFSAILDGTTYYFHSYESAVVQSTSNGRYYAQLEIREGTLLTNTWTMDTDKTQRFILSNPQVDTSVMTVTVYEGSSDLIGTVYSRLEQLNQFDNSSTVYDIAENADGSVELIFGDDILSKAIEPGWIVKCEYLACSGSAANNITTFSLIDIPGEGHDYQMWSVTAITTSHSGGDREDIENIRLNAPRFFQRQSRNVTADDYMADALNRYSNIIDAITVWGGENNDPPEYGTVFICIKPPNAIALSTIQKNNIISALEENCVVCIQPKIVDPTVVYVDMVVTLTYYKTYLTMTTDALSEKIVSTVESFFKDTASTFNTDFRYSKLLATICNIDLNAIIDCEADITIHTYQEVSNYTTASYTFEFQNEIEPGTVLIGPWESNTTGTSLPYMYDRDSDGKLWLSISSVESEIGTVDYEAGIVYINNYMFTISSNELLKVQCTPASKSMALTRDYLFYVNSVSTNLVAKESLSTGAYASTTQTP